MPWPHIVPISRTTRSGSRSTRPWKPSEYSTLCRVMPAAWQHRRAASMGALMLMGTPRRGALLPRTARPAPRSGFVLPAVGGEALLRDQQEQGDVAPGVAQRGDAHRQHRLEFAGD